jgi:hypothetical protein
LLPDAVTVSDLTMSSRRASRLGVSLALGVVTFALVAYAFHGSPPNGDFWRPWLGAKALLSGTTPYGLFSPTGPYAHEFPDLYPLVASVPLLPLMFLPFDLAAGAFSGISAALLAWAITAKNFNRLPIFLSLPTVIALYSSQWSVIYSAAFILPVLSFLYIAKPTIGLGMLAARANRRGIISFAIGASVMLALSLIIAPGWVGEWITTVRAHSGHMIAPVLQPGGFIALLALLRWKRPEARLIVALALVPQNIAWYDSVPLLLVPLTLMESLVSTVLMSIPIILEVLTKGGSDGVVDFWPRGYELAIFAYLPAVVAVLRRPNSID